MTEQAISEKTCSKCKLVKPADCFSKNKRTKTGLASHCKDCCKIAAKIQRAKRRASGKDAAYRKKYNQSEEGKVVIAAYDGSDARKKSYRIHHKKYRTENPVKLAAHRAIKYGVEDGSIIKPMACSVCDKKTRIEGHHCDYAKPLDVIWLCRQCHKDWHTENGPGLNGERQCTKK